MCGIVGLAGTTPQADGELLVVMRDTMRHRGPDDAGVWWSDDRRVGLAQRRLAIIDLSPAGHQPMTDAAGNWIVFNGEIYNYRQLRDQLESQGERFRSSSDTEVILAAYRAWGCDCLEKLQGMFAFALYDVTARRLFLARDRAGEKPLFYHHAEGRLAFASELKALLADRALPRRLDRKALEFYLTYGYVPTPHCMIRGVRKLPQGHAMTFELETGSSRVWRYWKLPEPAHDGAEEEQLVDELEQLLTDAVRRQLVADVPLGVLLSGGIDSSLVTALAAKVSSRPVQTFNIAFPGHGAFDEGPYARQVAAHFGTQHTELNAEPGTVDLLPELARQFDEPLADSSMVPTFLVSRMIRQHATVALGGDGGDELFGGYSHHRWLLQMERQRRWLPRPLLAALGWAVRSLVPLGVKGRNYLLALAGNTAQSIAQFNVYFDPAARRRLLAIGQANGAASPATEEFKIALANGNHSPLGRATAVDFMTYLADDILVKVDRASMLTSLEVRAPFLDHRVVEFAFRRVPDRLRATHRQRKILPRRLAARLLPKGMDLARKQGFSLPLSAWFRGEWGQFVQQVLDDVDPQIFHAPAVRSLLAAQRQGFGNTQRLFALTMFELWRKEYGVAA